MGAWVVLSTAWKLEDVQAGLNVIITVLCVTFVFTSSRYLWHSSARKTFSRDDVPLTSLLTFSTLGEVMDVVDLFRGQLFQRRYALLTAQCVFVVFFSLSAVFAGPISRYSTRVGEITGLRLVQGRKTSRDLSCDVNNNVKWYEVYNTFQNAGLPLDQLVDYVPDNGTRWVYKAAEWNSTYTASCSFTPQTPIVMNATGNYVNDTLLYLYFELPQLWNILSPRFQRDDIIHNTYYGGYRNPEAGVWDDVLLWQYVDLTLSNTTNELNASAQTQAISLASIYMKNIPEFNLTVASASKDWAFGVGEAQEAFYTKVECDITRNRPADDENFWEAYPQIRSNCDLAQQMDLFWSATAIQPSGVDYQNDIRIPTGQQLFRFFQAWMAAKDTYYPYPESRDISVRLGTVELSIVFIVVCGAIILVVLLGLLHGLFFWLKHRRTLERIPESKVDWLLQAVQETRCAATQYASPDLKGTISQEKEPHSSQKSDAALEAWQVASFAAHPIQATDQPTRSRGQIHVAVGALPSALSLSSSPPVKVQSHSSALDKSVAVITTLDVSEKNAQDDLHASKKSEVEDEKQN